MGRWNKAKKTPPIWRGSPPKSSAGQGVRQGQPREGRAQPGPPGAALWVCRQRGAPRQNPTPAWRSPEWQVPIRSPCSHRRLTAPAGAQCPLAPVAGPCAAPGARPPLSTLQPASRASDLSCGQRDCPEMRVLRALQTVPVLQAPLKAWLPNHPHSLPAKGLEPPTSSPPRGQRWVRAPKSPHPMLSEGGSRRGSPMGEGQGAEPGKGGLQPREKAGPGQPNPPVCPLAGGDEQAPAPGRGWLAGVGRVAVTGP